MKPVTSNRVGRRIRLRHHVVELADRHEVGVSVGGHGLPMVFLHGLGLNRRAYLRLLSRVAGLGFLVVAIDTAGHGDTCDLPCEAAEFDDRVDLVVRTLDALGVRQAIFAGHSMGGRMAIQLAAGAPDRALAAILFDPAAGASFDAAVSTVMHSPRQMLRAITGAVCDLYRDPFRMQVAAGSRYLRMLAAVSMRRFLPPTGFTGAAQAIMQSGECTPLLHTMRDHDIPTMVVHGENDSIVPFESACEVAHDANATLYRVRDAGHSWLIADPRHGADSVRQLLNGALGEVLRRTAVTLNIEDWRDIAAWDRATVTPDARVRALNGSAEVIGVDERRRVAMDLVRRAKWPRKSERPAVHQFSRLRTVRTA